MFGEPPVGRGSRRSAEDLPEVRVQGINPDFFKWGNLLVVFFKFASTSSFSEPDPIGRLVRDAGKVWHFHEAFQQHRFIAVAPDPVGPEGCGNAA
jgi:hypothetical protein